MPTYRLTLEYEGTRYHGWQEQPGARTVAGELRRAIQEAAGPPTDLGGSGRTDAGVHALAQVAHLRLPRRLPDLTRFRHDVNDRLPADIHLLSVAAAPHAFHARHDARARSYLYQVATRRTAFAKRFVWWVRRPLDVARLRAAAPALSGRHDFVRFCERHAGQTSTLVVVEHVEIGEVGGLILIRLVASHFLWKMVRRVVGALVRVGAGEMTAGELAGLLTEQRARRRAAPAAKTAARDPGQPAEWTAPPSGLFLERVMYAGEAGMGPLVPAFPVSAPPQP